MSYRITLDKHDNRRRIVTVVGCGGTGSIVAEGLCRILDYSQGILLIDYDRVEPHNLRRQNFHNGEIGKFKSQALAERLSLIYGRAIAYSVHPYRRHLINTLSSYGHWDTLNSGIIIGCVDNPEARREIANGLERGDWWIDAGNGYHSGQVLIGNITGKEMLKACFDEKEQTVRRLPAPSLQLPSLLAPVYSPRPQRDCAQAVEDEDQSPVINQAMATLVLNFVYKLFRGELEWMASYIDLEAGTLSSVPAEPVTVAKMMSVLLSSLWVKKDKSLTGRRS